MSSPFLSPTDIARSVSRAPEHVTQPMPESVSGEANPVPECAACKTAETNPYTGEMRAGCVSCVVRGISNSPKSIRDQYYGLIKDDAERASFKAAVLAEFGRRNSLIAKRAREAGA